MNWLRYLRAGLIGVACGVVRYPQPGPVIATLALLAAFLITDWLR